MFDVNNCFTHDGAGGLVQTVTADAASTNIIDLDATTVNVGGGKKSTYIVIKSIAAFATTVSIEIQLQTGAAADFGTTPKEIQAWRFLLAQMTAGALLVNQALPVWTYQRYLRLYFNVFTNATTGSFFACLSDSPEPHETDIDLEMAGT